MESLGQFLYNARVARNIDLRDAAQQTRINIQYLAALEQEDFTKLPGEVFVKGFLKNYCRFLNLDEAEVMKKYAELKPRQASSPSPAVLSADKPAAPSEPEERKETPLEPFVWAAVIFISFLVFLFTYLPAKQPKNALHPVGSDVLSRETASAPASKPAKIYLEVVANEDTWILIRTDDSPQKKAVLAKGDRLTWSADDRFVLSYGHVGAVQLLLGGQELTVNGTKGTVVRDLVVTREGILNQPEPEKQARPLKKPAAAPQQAQAQQEQKVQPQIKEQQVSHPASQPPAPPVPAQPQAPAASAPSAPAQPPAQ